MILVLILEYHKVVKIIRYLIHHKRNSQDLVEGCLKRHNILMHVSGGILKSGLIERSLLIISDKHTLILWPSSIIT
jgi:hypothetical protein